LINYIVPLFKMQLKFEEKDNEVFPKGKKDEEVKDQGKKVLENMLNRERKVNIKRIVVHLHTSLMIVFFVQVA